MRRHDIPDVKFQQKHGHERFGMTTADCRLKIVCMDLPVVGLLLRRQHMGLEVLCMHVETFFGLRSAVLECLPVCE